MGKRSYGSGQLFVRADGNGRETYYGSWRVGGRRVKRRLGPKRRAGTSDGLTRTQAEAELRRRIATEVVVAGAQRRTVAEAGGAYIDHLERVMQRKRTTIQDYRGYLRRHLAPFFGGRPLDKIDRDRIEMFMLAKLTDGLSPKTVQNLLNFLWGRVVPPHPAKRARRDRRDRRSCIGGSRGPWHVVGTSGCSPARLQRPSASPC